jgi:8-oxo-dGTP pyrophosphatase MutT (NUDIX family)
MTFLVASAARPSAVLQAQWELTEKSHWLNCIRCSVDEWCYEVPAGGLSPGVTPEEVARQELSEEIGGTAADLRYVGQFYTSNRISN